MMGEWILISAFTILSIITPILADREWYLVERFDETDVNYYARTIFSSLRTCLPEKDSKIPETRKTRPNLWSALLNDYLFFNEKTIISEDGRDFLKDAFQTDYNYHLAFLGVPIFIALVLAFGLLAVFVITILGILVFRVVFFLFNLCTSNAVRQRLRRIVIQMEIIRRAREDYLIEASHITKKPPKRKFKMSEFLKEVSDEDLPEELAATMFPKHQIEDDENSSDSEIGDAAAEEAEEARLKAEAELQKKKAAKKQPKSHGSSKRKSRV